MDVLYCVLLFILGAIYFGMVATDLSKKRYIWFGFDLMGGILTTALLVKVWLVL